MIALVDYGLGNIQAFANIYRRLGFSVMSATKPAQLEQATKIILPGVGAFDWAMSRLNSSGLRETLDEMVLNRKVGVLGVCVGMQIMARRSEEGNLPGLGWIEADVVRFDTKTFPNATRLPHMGWNDVEPQTTETLFRNLGAPCYYFLHSYYVSTDTLDIVIGTTTYGTSFASAVRSENIYGTQFHPEKSHYWGIQLLRNFAEI